MVYRIDNATAVTIQPTIGPVGPNPNSFFTDGNPASGIAATVVDDDWLNMVQEELANAAKLRGGALSKTNNAQLLAILTSFRGNTFLAYSSGTYSWMVPEGVYFVKVRLWGGGGSGGNTANTGTAGSGGGAGGYGEGVWAVTPGQVIQIVVASGGVASGSSTTQGTAGGTSSFGTMLTCTGGGAGFPTTSGAQNTVPSGGIATQSGASGQPLLVQGAGGGVGLVFGGIGFGGQGGYPFGGSLSFATGGGSSPGGGAGGGNNGNPGGAGGGGLAILEF